MLANRSKLSLSKNVQPAQREPSRVRNRKRSFCNCAETRSFTSVKVVILLQQQSLLRQANLFLFSLHERNMRTTKTCSDYIMTCSCAGWCNGFNNSHIFSFRREFDTVAPLSQFFFFTCEVQGRVNFFRNKFSLCNADYWSFARSCLFKSHLFPSRNYSRNGKSIHHKKASKSLHVLVENVWDDFLLEANKIIVYLHEPFT